MHSSLGGGNKIKNIVKNDRLVRQKEKFKEDRQKMVREKETDEATWWHFPRQRAMARRPNRCFVECDGSTELTLCPRKFPILLIVDMEPGAQPPSASTTIGTHSTPAARHEGRFAESLRLTHTSREVTAASDTVSCCKGDI